MPLGIGIGLSPLVRNGSILNYFTSPTAYSQPENNRLVAAISNGIFGVAFTITGGLDAAKFAIGETDGILSFITAPDYEAPTDSNTDNIYNVIVTAAKGSVTQTKELNIHVTNVDASNETVIIGTQRWHAYNFNEVVTAMGTTIPEVTDNTAWAALTTPAWCWPNGNAANSDYGRIYNGYAAVKIEDDIRAYNLLHPTATMPYRVPLLNERVTLYTYLGGAAVAGGKLKSAGLTYWNTPNTGADNSTGFRGLGAGIRLDTGGFSNFKAFGMFWAYDSLFGMVLRSSSADLTNSNAYIANSLKNGFSIRMISTLSTTELTAGTPLNEGTEL